MGSHAIETAFPLTPLQQAVVLASVRDPEGSPYQVQCQVDLRGDLDPERLAEAWRRLIRRHAAFRSFFAWEGREEPLQVVRADAPLPWAFQDWRGFGVEDQERRWASLRATDATSPFDLARAPILRLRLVRLGDQRFRLLWSLHHALADGWSALSVLREMVEAYDAVLDGTPPDPPSPPSFALFVSWLEARDREAAQAYWTEQLQDLGDASPLPATRGQAPGPRRATVDLELDTELSAAVTEAAARMRVTPYTLLLGAWSLVLARHAHEEDSITFGTTVTERPPEIPGVGASVGMYLNTIPLRIPAPRSTTTREWLQAIQRIATEARHHGVSGLGEIGRWADLEPGGVLARSLVVLESFPDDVRELPRGRTLRLENLRVSAPSDLPLALLGHPGESIRLELAYDTALWAPEDARRLLTLTSRALRGLSDPRVPTPEAVELLGPTERRTLLEDWCGSPVPEPPAPDVLEAFDAAVRQTPDAPAVRDGEATLTYGELDRSANRLAHRLLALELGDGGLIGVPARPGVDTVISILACLKAGLGYVPFDPDQPRARLDRILDSVDRVLALDEGDPCGPGSVPLESLDREAPTPPRVERNPDRIAYVVFTSGSTGLPKSVVVERGQLARSTAARLAWYDEPPKRFLLLSSLAVDSSVAGLYWTLCTGGCLVLVPSRAEQDARGLARRIETEAVTTTLMVPGLWRALLEEAGPSRLGSLRCVVVAGEACPPSLVALHHRQLPGARLVNEYGPSEVTVWATAEELVPEPGPVSIGRPIPFVRVHLLDARGRLVPPGAPGEICLAGSTVARGYLEADRSSADRFVPDPFVPGGRMYRTGDRGRFREDGRLDFLGRIDDQIKIRGYRIEPGEIESVLDTAPGVVEAAVVMAPGPDGAAVPPSPPDRTPSGPERGTVPASHELVAVLRTEDPRPSEDELRLHARERLPGYMVPGRFVFLDSLPRTAAGKVDRRALAARVAALTRKEGRRNGGPTEGAAHRRPSSEAERILAGIWSSILGVDEVFVDEDFFRLGGDSLLSIRAIARAKRAGLEIDPRQFFASPTIASLAAVAARAAESEPESGSPTGRRDPSGEGTGASALPPRGDGPAPLSFAQEGFWVLDRLDPGDRAYNVAVRLDLRGPLNADLLGRAFRDVVTRHDALRSTVRVEGGRPRLEALPPDGFTLERTDFSDLGDPEERVRALARELARHRFDLEGDPLVRGVLARIAPDRHTLLLTFHHMVVDGDSLTRVLEDLGAAYRREGSGGGEAGAPAASYRDYAAWERERWDRGDSAPEGLLYWSERLAGIPERIQWPPDDRDPGGGVGNEGAIEARHLPREVADALGELCRARGCTPFVLLLAAYQVLLHRHSGQDVVVVGTPAGHRPHRALDEAVGYFQNMLPFRADLSGNPTFSEFLSQVRDTVAGALAHAHVPFEKIVEALAPRRTAAFTPLFQTALIFRDGTRSEDWRSALDLTGVEATAEVLHNGGAKFELGLEVERTDAGLTLLAEYAEARFGAGAVARLLERFEVLLRGVLEAPDRRVQDLPVMTAEERVRVLGPWSAGAAPGPRVFVLDAHGHPVPPGVPGELCIAGLPVAPRSGGAADPLPDPLRDAAFPEAAGARLYPTGARVRFRRDGSLDFLPPPPDSPTVETGTVGSPTGRPHPPAAALGAGEPPALDRFAPSRDGAPSALPEDPGERAVAAIWSEVLGVAPSDRDDDFFALGGHSLKAISVLVRLEEAFGVEVPLAAFFEAPTVAGLAALLGPLPSGAEVEAGGTAPDPEAGTGRYPLSPDQSRLWYLQRLEPGSPAYNVPMAYRLTGPLNLPALQEALDLLVRKHDALRTTIDGAGDEPVQVVHPATPLPLPRIDLPEDAPEVVFRQAIEEEATTPFDLEDGPLVRARLLRRSETEHHLVLTFHHLVADGWSLGLVARELSESYAEGVEALRDGGASPRPASSPEPGALEAPLLRWGPWCADQRAWLESEACRGELAFWTDRLRDVPPLELPTDRLRPDRPSYRGRTHGFRLSRELSEGLEARCRGAGVTPFAGLLSAFKVLLHRYAGQRDLAVGTVVAGRRSVASEGMVGLFANTLVVRTELDEGWSAQELLAEVGRRSVEALEHQRVPFAAVVEAVRPRRDPSRNPLFQVAFLLQNQDAPPLRLPGLDVQPEPVETGTAKFDLTLAARRDEDGYALVLEYASDLFHEETIRRMAGHLETLISGLAGGFAGPVSTLPMVQDPTEWSLSGPARAVSGQPLHARVSEQARRTPDAVAVTDEAGRSVGYRELDIRSHRIAVALVARGIGSGDVVAVGLPRDTDLVAALLGILKAGAAYLPLDPELPAPRLTHIVRDAGASLLLTTAELEGRFPPGPPSVLLSTLLEDALSGVEDPARPHAPDFPAVEPEDLAYLIYTSGSTGGPKGVEVTHGNAVNLLDTMGVRPGLDADTRWLAVTTLSFDISLLEIFGPLWVGGQVVLASGETAADGRALLDLLARVEPTHMQATPATWRMLLDVGWRGDGRLKALVGGEALPPELARELTGPCGEVWNMYGPTETTVWSTCGRVDGSPGPIQVGTPVANTRLYLLDEAGQPVPRGVPGELYIAGAGVTAGYRSRPELTAERFLADPFANDGGRMYRTGDRVRLLGDGTLEVLGRLDGQVKIRGFRIETGEVEATLEEHPAIRRAVVRAFGTGTPDARLVAFAVPDPDRGVTGSEVRRFVRERLPRYMVPSMISLLDELPLTPNGKVDRKALVDPLESRRPEAPDHQPPATAVQRTIAQVWSDLLGGVRVGRGDNFFELGGHSLLSIRAVEEIRRRTGHHLDPRAFFFQSVEQLAAGLEEDGGAS